MRAFEDLHIGDRHLTATETVGADDIVRFAREWDPQPFHLDPEAAKASLFGSLVASGLHTMLVTYRLFDKSNLLGGTALAGLGYSDIRFLAPVRAGDRLRVSVIVADKRESRRRDGGIVTFRLETRNQDSILVLTLSVAILVAYAETAAR